jgi:hypothetical protein
MGTNATERWIEAGKVLAKDPSARVRCPERDDGMLTVHDSVLVGDQTMMERRLVCDQCGAQSVIRMPVPKPGW